jgi:predicted GIY-YIG superfamily endonuclease
MDFCESSIQSFIIKVWIEENAEEGGQVKWRGRITHVPSRQDRYLKNLGAVETFIAPYLETMGVDMGMRWRIKKWLKRWKLYLRQ